MLSPFSEAGCDWPPLRLLMAICKMQNATAALCITYRKDGVKMVSCSNETSRKEPKAVNFSSYQNAGAKRAFCEDRYSTVQ